MGIGNITVPPLAPFQTINLVQNITLPAVPPWAIVSYTTFALTMTQDADSSPTISIPTSRIRARSRSGGDLNRPGHHDHHDHHRRHHNHHDHDRSLRVGGSAAR